MALLPILTFPDSRLREISVSVDKVTPDLVQFAKNMLETMYDARGIGLAAPQVDKRIRLIVIDIRRSEKDDNDEDIDPLTDLEKKIQFPLILFNPVVVSGKGKTSYEEGCLSVPGFNETVERYNEVEVEALSIKNEKLRFKTDGLLAICIQHELDHLEGKLFIDRISMLKSNRIKAKIKKSGYPPRNKKDKNNDSASNSGTNLDFGSKDPIKGLKTKKQDKILV